MVARFFKLFAWTSLLFLLASAALCVRCHWYQERIAYSGAGGVYRLIAHGEGLTFTLDNIGEEHDGWNFDEFPIDGARLNTSIPPRSGVHILGFGYEHHVEGSLPAVWDDFDIPEWFVLGTLAIAPAICSIARFRQRSRRGADLCPHCGYDLRATPQQCPECGAVSLG